MKSMNPAPATRNFTSDWFKAWIRHWKKHVAHLRNERIHALEIGSYEGRSACWICENLCQHCGSDLTCIDIWEHPDIEGRFDENTIGLPIIKHKGPSHEVVRHLPLDYFDLAYIDGGHDYISVLEDAVHCFRLVKSGGFLIFDDYRWKNPHGHEIVGTPQKPIDAFLELYGHQLELLHKDYQVFLRKK